MLHLHLSNRTEQLLHELLLVTAEPLPSVFQSELIVVEEPGMARWLSWQIAQCRGIAANVQFPLPAAFLWQVLHAQLQQDATTAAFSKGSLLWLVLAVLPGLRKTAGFESIDHYLSGADEETRLYQLSRELADLFDQYLVYRPDLILAWEQQGDDAPTADKDARWQAQLWRAMRQQANAPHWPGLLDAFRRSVQQQGLRPGVLPARVSLFAVAALSPGYIELLGLLAAHVDIHVFLLNPSREYWGDIVPEKVLARLRDRWRQQGAEDVTGLYGAGNPLLASMGRPRRDFIERWLELPGMDSEAWVPAGAQHLLALLQDDLLELRTRGTDTEPPLCIAPDASLRVLACYSPLREVEALHDELLELFDTLPDLKPHEIVVMAPDISVYAPAIEAVFGAAPAGRSLPFSISAGSLLQQPLLDLLLAWLRLPQQRFDAPTVIGWLELAAVQRRLGLDAEQLARVREWVHESAIRWGLDARHKAVFGLPNEQQNTWDFGLRRLFLGYAMPDAAPLFAGVAPVAAVEGSAAPTLGSLQLFLDQLAAWQRELQQPATLRDWQARLNRMIEQLLDPLDEEVLHIDTLRQLLARLVQQAALAGFDAKIGAAVLQQHLARQLQSAAPGFNLLNGRISCTDLVALRAVPFRVVCVLGLNDAGFPRSQRSPGFDLMARAPRKGDRSLRDDDRLLFLEALLSARDAVRLSYVGRSQQDNSERQPSVVLSELLDYLAQGYRLDKGRLHDWLWREQPLQPFSARAFSAGSYASEWLERLPPALPFAAEALPAVDTTLLRCSLAALARCLGNPARTFLERSIGIRLTEEDPALESHEPFTLDGLQAYGVRNELLELLLAETPPADSFATLQARGSLPPGALAASSFADLHETLEPFAAALRPRLAASRSIEVDLASCDVPLYGRVARVVDDGVLHFRAVNKLKPQDLLACWVEHLALCASGLQGSGQALALEDGVCFRALPPATACELLLQLLDLYRQNLQRVLPLLPQASLEYARLRAAGKLDAQAALEAAMRKWDSDDYRRGDGSDAWLALAFRDRSPFGEEFCALSLRVWQPLVDSLQEAAA